jgi:hypothetical protein
MPSKDKTTLLSFLDRRGPTVLPPGKSQLRHYHPRGRLVVGFLPEVSAPITSLLLRNVALCMIAPHVIRLVDGVADHTKGVFGNPLAPRFVEIRCGAAPNTKTPWSQIREAEPKTM